MSAGSQVLPSIPWYFPPSHFLPSRGITMKGERSGCQSWSESRDHSKSSELLCSHTLFSLEVSHTGNSATCSTDEGTRYNLINTRVHRCWRFRRLEETSKSNLFHHTAPERIQLYLCHSWLILRQCLTMLKSLKSKFSNPFHCFNLIISEPTTYHLVGHGQRCFTTALWH